MTENDMSTRYIPAKSCLDRCPSRNFTLGIKIVKVWPDVTSQTGLLVKSIHVNV